MIFVSQDRLGKFSLFGETTDVLSQAFVRVRSAAQNLDHERDKIAEVLDYRGLQKETTDVLNQAFVRIHEADIEYQMSVSGLTRQQVLDDIYPRDPLKMGRDLLLAKITYFDDESLLLWHITTELCLLRDKYGAPSRDTHRLSRTIETLSDYMMYLLIKQPEMLSARTGIWLMRFQDTCAEARRFFDSMGKWIQHPDDARKALLGVDTSEPPTVVKGEDSSMSLLFDACILAKGLRELDEDLMLTVLVEVWLRMLIFAARKCPGSTHVRQLNRGGELITLIWFLMEHMGLGEMYDDVTEGGLMAKIVVIDQ